MSAVKQKIAALSTLFALLISIFQPVLFRVNAQADYCEFGQRTRYEIPAHVRVSNFSDDIDEKTVGYTVPSGWAIESFSIKEVSRFGITSLAPRILAEGTKYISKQQLDRASEYIDQHNGNFEYAELKIKADAYFAQKRKQYYAAVQEFAASKTGVYVYIAARGHGRFSDKTSYLSIVIYGTNVCVGQPDVNAFVQKLSKEIDAYVLPYSIVCIHNNASRPVYFDYQWAGYDLVRGDPLLSGSSRWFTYNHTAKTGAVSPEFSVRFDRGSGDIASYGLKRQATEIKGCDGGKEYEFLENGSKIELYDTGH
jgi:hypothetical protein